VLQVSHTKVALLGQGCLNNVLSQNVCDLVDESDIFQKFRIVLDPLSIQKLGAHFEPKRWREG
jgi:hypothetical protein